MCRTMAAERGNAGARQGVRPRADGVPVLVQEPGVVELRDGRLMMFCRTDAGSQFVAWSVDGGVSWSELGGSQIILAALTCLDEAHPVGPATCLPGTTMPSSTRPWRAGARPSPWHYRTMRASIGTTSETSRRTPIGWYCYTAIAFTPEHILLAYCAGDRRENNGLATLQITRVPLTWLYEGS